MASEYVTLNGRLLNTVERKVYPPGTTVAQAEAQKAATKKQATETSSLNAIKAAVAPAAPPPVVESTPVQPTNSVPNPAPAASPPAAGAPQATSQTQVAEIDPGDTPIAALMTKMIFGDAPPTWSPKGNGKLVADPLWRTGGGVIA